MSSYRQAGTVLTDHTFSVPLDHDRPEGERIEIFAREVTAADPASARLPWLLFLQGGPAWPPAPTMCTGSPTAGSRRRPGSTTSATPPTWSRPAGWPATCAATTWCSRAGHRSPSRRSRSSGSCMYVPAELSLPTAHAIRGLKAWVTSEFEHDGLRVSNGVVLDRLIALARGTA